MPIALFVVISIGSIFFSKPSGDEVLRDATASFSEIDRGTFDFSIKISPRGSAAGQPATIRLYGPFELAEGDELPTARIEYTVTSGEQSQTSTLITTGTKAYVDIQGQAYELPAKAVKQLSEATKDLRKSEGADSGLAGLDLNFDEWLTNPEVGNGGDIGGQKTWRVDADVDVVAALSDLVKQAKTLGTITGSQLPEELSKQDTAELRKSIKNSFVRVNVGRYDGLLRLFDLTMDVLAPTGGQESGPLSGGRVNIAIAISNPNQPVNVEVPPNALPFEALQSLGAGATGGTGR